MGHSKPEETLAWQMRVGNLPMPTREYQFHPKRRWKFDFAWPDRMFAVEVEGGLYTNGRHTRGAGYEKDIEKYNEALLLGWRVLRVSPAQIRKGQALTWIIRAFAVPISDNPPLIDQTK